MSSHNGGARSADRSWGNALNYIAVDGRFISALEVSDFCSVLYLAERVHVVGRGGSRFAANRLATQLTTLNYPVQVDRLATVEATDTVVVICGPDLRDRQSVADVMPRTAADTGAVLLAIAADDCSSLLRLADAVVTIPLPRPRRRMDDQPACVLFELLVSLTVDVIGRDLAGRISSKAYPIAAHQPLAAVGNAGIAASQSPRLSSHRLLKRCKAVDRNWS